MKYLGKLGSKNTSVKNLRSQVHLDIGWNLDIGDCEVLLGGKFKPHETEVEVVKKPRGTIRLTSSNKQFLSKQYENVEKQLIEAKMSAALWESEKIEMSQSQRLLQQQFDELKRQFGIQMEKAREERESLESTLVLVKMDLAQTNMEAERLQTQIRRSSQQQKR